MFGIHHVFPPSTTAANDPILLCTLLKGEAQWAVIKEILGLMFDGQEKMIWLSTEKMGHPYQSTLDLAAPRQPPRLNSIH
jgi:hypothetical protein